MSAKRHIGESVRLTLTHSDMNTIMLAIMWVCDDPDWQEDAEEADWDGIHEVEAKIQAARKRLRGGAW